MGDYFGIRSFVALLLAMKVLAKPLLQTPSFVVDTADALIMAGGFGKFQFQTLVCSTGFISYTTVWSLQHVLVSRDIQASLNNESAAAVSLAASIYFASWGVGAVLLASLADKKGRRWVALWSCLIAVLCSMLSTAAGSFCHGRHLTSGCRRGLLWLYMCKFGVGFSAGGVISSIYPLAKEWTPPEHYVHVTAVINAISWSICAALLAILSSAISSLDWQQQVQLVQTLVIGFTIVSYFRLPESLPFLVLSGRETEALRLLESVAKSNGAVLPKDLALRAVATCQEQSYSQKLRKLVGSPLFPQAVILWVSWFTVTISCMDYPFQPVTFQETCTSTQLCFHSPIFLVTPFPFSQTNRGLDDVLCSCFLLDLLVQHC